MIYTVTLFTLWFDIKLMTVNRSFEIWSPVPVIACVHTPKKTNAVAYHDEKKYTCETEKLYASITGVEFINVTVSGVNEV